MAITCSPPPPTVTKGWPAECFREGKCGSGRFPNGTIMHDPVRYPSGIKALADYVHSLGLRFGIYLDAGATTCAGFPGSLGHEAADVAWIASIGADYLWLDGCNLDGALMEEKYVLWSRLLNESGREIPWEVSLTFERAWPWAHTHTHTHTHSHTHTFELSFTCVPFRDYAHVYTQVSWPAYTYRRASTANATGANPFNQDLWFHSAAVGHEFRFYNDNNAEWAHILDIAAFTHEAGMTRYVRCSVV